jgi:biotin carboxyl carrier protein
VKVGDEVFRVEVEPDAAAASVDTVTFTGAPAASVAPGSAVTAPMPGLVLRYLVNAGDSVKAGDPVVLLEAMKMQNNLPAPRDGRIATLRFKAGDSVNRGDVLLTLE